MFEEKLKALSQRAAGLIPHLATEEATKNALIMPFISALGYDVFNPMEVVPEFNADIGIKKGEKVDYAIKRNDEIIMIVEAKRASATLGAEHSNQLFRYFTATKARIAILTNGTLYQFFSDLEERNKMDDKPFLELDLLNLRENAMLELKRLTRESFDLESMLDAASDLKYMRVIRSVLEQQLEAPDRDFVQFFFHKAAPTRKYVQSAREQFTRLVKNSLHNLIKDRVADKLRSALTRTEAQDEPTPPPPERLPSSESSDDTESDAQSSDTTTTRRASAEIETTDEEVSAYNVVKAILCNTISPERITYKDTRSYFNVLLDGKAGKPICRLYLHTSKKKIGVFDASKKETRHSIDAVNDIYKFSEALLNRARWYDAPATDDAPAS
jgi:hypothetical protein